MNASPSPPNPAACSIALSELFNRPSIAREFFIPPERASWEGDNYTLGKGDPAAVRPTIAGLRLQEPDPNKVDPYRERTTQGDLARLVKSLQEMRRHPQLAGLTLSAESYPGRDPSNPHCKRLIFGLKCPGEQFKNDIEAAKENHGQLLAAMKKAGFRPAPGMPAFDPQTGMKGLGEWVAGVRLQRAPAFDRRWLLLLGLLPLLLLCLLPWSCNKKGPPLARGATEHLFGMDLTTDSFLILVDKSGSMQSHFNSIRAETKRLLAACRKRPGKTYANVIVYDQKALSALGKIEPLDDTNVGKLGGYLDVMQAGGGTNLASAIELAAKETKEHGKKTTLLILTDGEDNTIRQLIANKDQIKASMGVDVVANTTTPRLFDGKGDSKPVGPAETGLADFSTAYSGRFGPSPEK